MKVVDFTREEQFKFTQDVCSAIDDMDVRTVLVVGIATAGEPLSREIYNKLMDDDDNVSLLIVKAQRPSTHAKKKNSFLKYIVKRLPKSINNLLRIVEHYLLYKKVVYEPRDIKLIEKNDVCQNYDLIVVVDDAIDSGNTMLSVKKYLDEQYNGRLFLVTLCNTVKEEDALITADFNYYGNALIRGEWSIDAKK